MGVTANLRNWCSIGAEIAAAAAAEHPHLEDLSRSLTAMCTEVAAAVEKYEDQIRPKK
jgi:hypothetical protein